MYWENMLTKVQSSVYLMRCLLICIFSWQNNWNLEYTQCFYLWVQESKAPFWDKEWPPPPPLSSLTHLCCLPWNAMSTSVIFRKVVVLQKVAPIIRQIDCWPGIRAGYRSKQHSQNAAFLSTNVLQNVYQPHSKDGLLQDLHIPDNTIYPDNCLYCTFYCVCRVLLIHPQVSYIFLQKLPVLIFGFYPVLQCQIDWRTAQHPLHYSEHQPYIPDQYTARKDREWGRKEEWNQQITKGDLALGKW